MSKNVKMLVRKKDYALGRSSCRSSIFYVFVFAQARQSHDGSGKSHIPQVNVAPRVPKMHQWQLVASFSEPLDASLGFMSKIQMKQLDDSGEQATISRGF